MKNNTSDYKNKILITSRLEENFTKLRKSNLLHIGAWSLKENDYKNCELKKNINLIKNRWNNLALKKKDYKYIKSLTNKYQKILPEFFNKYHGIKKSKYYWTLLSGIWINYYIPFQYYRWKAVSEVLKRNHKIRYLQFNFKNYPAVLDTVAFYKAATTSDVFNYFYFQRIILNKKNKFKIIKKNKFISFEENKIKILKDNRLSAVKKLALNLINIFFSLLIKKKIYLIYDGFKFLTVFFFNIFLKQVPINHNLIFNWYNIRKKFFSEININKRELFKKKINFKSEFEDFLYECIFKDIPYCFLEKYNAVINDTKKILLEPKIVLSGTQHFYNEKFKFWIAEKNIKNNFFIVRHGGYHQKYSSIFGYESLISRDNLEWVKKKNQINLPAGKYIFYSKKRKKLKYLLFVGYEIHRYPCRIDPGPTSEPFLVNVKDLLFLNSNLKNEIVENFIYCPKFGNIKEQMNLIKNIMGPRLLESNSFNKYLYQSKLTICSYPNTAYFDSMLTGPTILLCHLNEWPPLDQLSNVYKNLIKNKLVFHDINELTKHINENWNKIEDWWNSKTVKSSVDNFLNKFNFNKPKSTEKWLKFIKKNSTNSS